MAKYTYIVSDTSAGDSTAIGAANQDVRVYKIIFGNPGDAHILNLYNKAVAFGHASGMGSVDTGNIAVQITQPTTAAGRDWVREVDFGPEGLVLDGGSVHTNGNDITVLWDPIA